MSENTRLQEIERRLGGLGQYDAERAQQEAIVCVAEVLCEIGRILHVIKEQGVNVRQG
ncbi:hypothetical protein LCGC14_2969140 [marine sediment metagenome]|uniref:Uncharacterized protein n=1 Tax=marine sediment metagenome TaxID=412755 RepID=A0A0F8XXG1_9ZZZZ